MGAHEFTTALLAVLVLGGVLAGVAAAQTGSITATPDDPGATASHVIVAPANNDSSIGFSALVVDYGDADVDLSNVTQENVGRMGIDQGGDFADARTNVRVADDIENITASDGTLTIEMGGNYPLSGNDEIILVLNWVDNPAESGTYNVTFDINPDSEGGASTATLAIGQAAATQTAATTTFADPSGSGGPGFGALAAIVGVLAVAFLALRRVG